MPVQSDFERLYSAKEAAQILNTSKKTLNKWCEEKRINYIRVPGGPFKFRRAAIELFIAQHEVKAINSAR